MFFYHFEDRKSDTLIVMFNSAAPLDNHQGHQYEFVNTLNKTKYDLLLFRSPIPNWYVNNYDSIIDIIKQHTSKKYKVKKCMGISMGAYASLIVGNIMDFNEVIAISAQTDITLEFTEKHKNFVHDMVLFRDHEYFVEYKKYFSTVDFVKNNSVTKNHIYNSQFNLHDFESAQLLEKFKNVEIHWMPSGTHTWYKDGGRPLFKMIISHHLSI